MINIEQQLHGYRHGHELLSASIRLSPQDQDVVDRLSDVAGPLGPGERFAPYLTCYPLPSGAYYVFARTWQDLTAPRAGCVRTRSLLVPMQEWMTLTSIANLAAIVTESGPVSPAQGMHFEDISSTIMPAVDGPGTELLEALFLEERMPVAVFGAEEPEIIALRLLTAIWPAYRRRFTMSTFCNSPRSIAKKSFDLVFAPIEARSRFSDWKGRRVDGGRRTAPRHHWSNQIVENVFRKKTPSLVGLDVLGAMAEDERGSEDALRVSLLWEDLYRKVASEPHAALGLLDIANTRTARNAELISGIEPALEGAAIQAVNNMSPPDAWRFLLTLANKLGKAAHRGSLTDALKSSAVKLARQDPSEAAKALTTLLRDKPTDMLIGAVGDGLAMAPINQVARPLSALKVGGVLQVLIASPALSRELFKEPTELDDILAADIVAAEPQLQAKARLQLLPSIVNDDYIETFRALLTGMSQSELLSQTALLYQLNRLQAPGLNNVILNKTEAAGAQAAVRELVSSFAQSPSTDVIINRLVEPTAGDLLWIVAKSSLSEIRRKHLLTVVVDRASRAQLKHMFSEPDCVNRALQMLGTVEESNAQLFARIAEAIPLDAGIYLELVLHLLPYLDRPRTTDLAGRGFDICLGSDVDEGGMTLLFKASGGSINSARAVRLGLARNVPADLASRNLVFFNKNASTIRADLLKAPELLAEAIVERGKVDFTYDASKAAGQMLWEGGSGRGQLSRSYSQLLSLVLTQHKMPASAIIAAVFPLVYRELKQGDAPDLFSLLLPIFNWSSSFQLLDLSPSKRARVELADGFVNSEWYAADVALAAARSGDATRILKQIASGKNGHRALLIIQRDTQNIPSPWRQEIQTAIKVLLKSFRS